MPNFLVSIMLKKGAKMAVASLVPLLILLIPILKAYGVDLQINEVALSAALTALMTGGVTAGLNYLKQKKKNG